MAAVEGNDGWEAEMRRGVLILSALAALAVAAPAAQAAKPVRASEVRAIAGDYNQGKPLPIRGSVKPAKAPARRAARARAAAVGQTPAVGTVKDWLALDDAQGGIYLKPYTLQAVSDHMEVWVANDLTFPEGDCRNDQRVVVTRAQAEYLANQFETDMYPKESVVFSVPPARDGANPVLGEDVAPAGYWGGEGDKIVTLIDNVRDDNFYDTDNASNLTYIAGFFYSVFNEFVDRNVMTIDAYDWLHRTGANPPDDSSSDLCTNAPARPFLYEGTFAHEYQHLLEYYEDPDEFSWVNEGVSDWAQTLTGYVDPSVPITVQDFDSHIQCFLGWLGVKTPANTIPRDGGPENSLTLWGDQGDGEVLCDYGAAYSMMEFLAGRYGERFMTALHRTDGNGFTGLQEALTAVGSRDKPADVLHDWAAMIALDGVLDRGASLLGGSARRLMTPTLDAVVNWDTPNAYDTPGAPPNGSDYVRLRDAKGRYVAADKIRSLTFDGAETLEAKPIEWTVDPAPADRPGNPALYSGSGPNFDRSIVRSVTVPAASPTLSFQTRWNTEPLWDFGFVQVSTDGGATYTSLGNADTTSEHDPGAIPQVVDNLPGFTGDSGGWKTETFNLSAYAGKSILLAFRYVTDSGTDLPGWWVDDVTVGGQPVSDGSTLDGWQSTTAVHPDPVAGYTVQLVGYSSKTLDRPVTARASHKGKQRHRRGHGRGDHGHGSRDTAFIARLPLNDRNQVALGGKQLRHLAEKLRGVDVVAALVMQDDPTELADRYARYTLTVNGVTQPGG
jgi:hypothetical protein